MPRDHILYEETQSWPPWVVGIVFGASLVGAAVILTARARGEPEPAPGVAAIAVASLVGAPLLVSILAGRLYVRVTRTAVIVGFGPVELFSRTIAFERIRALQVVRYSPLREFGGWGYRRGWGRRTAWTVRGNRALVVHELDGRRTYLGSDDPGRLRARIEAAAGSGFA